MRRTAFNLLSVIGGEALMRVANFLAVVVIARLYGAETLGLYATILAYATVAVMIAENGLQISSISELAGAPESVDAIFSSVCSLRVLLFGLMSLILLGIGRLENWSSEIWIVGLLVIIRVYLYSYSQLQFSVLKGINRMSVIGPVQAANFVALMLGVAATYHYRWSLIWLLACFIISQTLEIVISLVLLWQSGIRLTKFEPSEWFALLKRSTPVGLTYVLMGLTMRADVIVLSLFCSAIDVGRFAAAHMGIVLLYATSWLFGSVLLPDFTRLREDPSEFNRYTTHWTRLLFVTAGSGALVLTQLARPIVLLLYGKSFATAASLATIMVLAVPFILLNSLYLTRAIALGAASTGLAIYFGSTVLAVALDASMSKELAATGVAIAIVIREVTIFCIFKVHAVANRIKPPQSGSLSDFAETLHV